MERSRAARRWAPLALAALAYACAAPLPEPPRTEPPAAEEPELNRLPFRVDSNVVESTVRGLAPDLSVKNSSMALFELAWLGSLARQEQLAAVAGQELEAARAGTSSAGGRQERSLAGGRDPSGAGVRKEPAAGGLLAERDPGSADKDSVSSQARGALIRRTDSASLAGQARLEAFLQRHVEKLSARNAYLAELLEQDRLLKQFFALNQEQLKQRIDAETVERKEVLELVKSASTREIVPGETFAYELVLRNLTDASIQSVILYDEFPQGLQFEDRYEGALLAPDGTERRFSGARELVSFLTPNEWEHGKIAWHIPGRLGPGATVRFRFLATFYLERGAPARPGVPIFKQPSAEAERAGTAGGQDLVLVARRLEPDGFLACSLRRKGAAERIDGFMRAADFRPSAEMDATELERRLQETVYFGGQNQLDE